MKKKNIRVDAIFEEDLEGLLENLSLLDEFRNNKLVCNICKNIITADNFKCIYPEAGKIKFCCNEIKCYEEILNIFR